MAGYADSGGAEPQNGCCVSVNGTWTIPRISQDEWKDVFEAFCGDLDLEVYARFRFEDDCILEVFFRVKSGATVIEEQIFSKIVPESTDCTAFVNESMVFSGHTGSGDMLCTDADTCTVSAV